MAQMLRNLGRPDTAALGDSLRLADLAHRAEPEVRVSEKWTRFSAKNDAPLIGWSIGSIPKVESTFGSDALAGEGTPERLRRRRERPLHDPCEAFGGMPEHLRGEIGPYEPTWRDRIAAWMLGDERPTLGRERLVRGFMGSTGVGSQLGLVDFVPVVGQGLGVQEAVQAGDPQAVGLALMPGGVPARSAVRPVLRAGMEGAEELVKGIERLYNPKPKPPLSPEAAPPNGARAVEHGRDIEGRPLTAKYVVGRRVVGGEDEALSPAEYDALSEAAFGTSPKAVAPREIRPDAGRFITTTDRRSGLAQHDILVSRALNPSGFERVLAHEIGHGIDKLAGGIPSRDM